MTWFWLSIPLATLFFLTWTLIPLWLVLKHPDAGPDIRTPERPVRSSASRQRASRVAGRKSDLTPVRSTAIERAG